MHFLTQIAFNSGI